MIGEGNQISSAISAIIGAIIGGICSWYGSKKAIEYQLKENQRVKREIISTHLDITTTAVLVCLEDPGPGVIEFIQFNKDMWIFLAEAAFLQEEYYCIARWFITLNMLNNAYLDAIKQPEYEKLDEIKKCEFLKNVFIGSVKDKKRIKEIRSIADKYRNKKL